MAQATRQKFRYVPPHNSAITNRRKKISQNIIIIVLLLLLYFVAVVKLLFYYYSFDFFMTPSKIKYSVRCWWHAARLTLTHKLNLSKCAYDILMSNINFFLIYLTTYTRI